MELVTFSHVDGGIAMSSFDVCERISEREVARIALARSHESVLVTVTATPATILSRQVCRDNEPDTSDSLAIHLPGATIA